MYETLMDGEPFIDRVLAGHERAQNIEKYLEAWHAAQPNTRAASVEIDEFLGMSWDEYKRWVEAPSTLRFIIAARKANISLDSLIEQTQVAGAAARSGGHSETAKLLEWLQENGDVEQYNNRD